MKRSERLRDKLPKFIPGSPDAADDAMSDSTDDQKSASFFRQSILIIGIALFIMLFFFIIAFFFAVRGAERTIVPNIVSLELTEAMVMLQERELYPRLQLKYTGTPDDKGLIIDQNPEAGLYVKAGRRITVTVSKGAVIDNVENYVGKDLDEVRGRLTTLFSTYEPLLYIREPVTYVYNSAPQGIVLSQSPEAGTPLGEPRELILIVSRGNSDRQLTLPGWIDWNSNGTLDSLASLPFSFRFIPDNVPPVGSAPRVRRQYPVEGTKLNPGSMVTLYYSIPDYIPEDSQYGLFSYELPVYPVPVLLEVFVLEPGNEERMFFSMPYVGGPVSFPYVFPIGTVLYLRVNGEEIHRQVVEAPG